MRILAVVLFVFASFSATAQNAIDPAVFKAFEEFAERQMKRDRMTGMSVAVLQGESLWARGFGFADVENQVAASEKSSYRMASVSKPMTAIAALRLAEMGKLDLDAPVQKYVPYFPDKGKLITVRLLLSHLGGISHYRNYAVEGNIRTPKSTRESIEIFAGFDLVNEPGTAYSYSSYGYNLVGAAIEGATGQKYADVMRELVWAPAGMTSTRMDSPTDIIPHRVTGYRLDDGELKRSDYVDLSSRFAGGGTRSTVIDMVRFAKAVDDGKLLRGESVDAMWWPARTRDGKSVGYGLGWSVSAVNGHFTTAHSGSQQETRTLLYYFPARDLAIAFASNFEDAEFAQYRDVLYLALTGEAWNPAMYAADAADRAAIKVAGDLVNAGGLYFEKYGRPAATGRRELQKAFADLDSDMNVVAGSWIVSKAGLEGGNPLTILKRYIESKEQPRIRPELARRIVALADEWEGVWTPEIVTDDAIEGKVAPYKGRRIIPNYADRLVDEVETSFGRGDVGRAVRLAKLAGETYSDHASAAAVYGISLALTGDEPAAEKWLRHSVALNPNGYASESRLAAIVREVERQGDRGAAGKLAAIAKRIHEK